MVMIHTHEGSRLRLNVWCDDITPSVSIFLRSPMDTGGNVPVQKCDDVFHATQHSINYACDAVVLFEQ